MSSFHTVEISDALFESEGLRFLTIKTKHLKGRGDICVYVPEVATSTKSLPIYILLHGVYGGAWIWALKGGAHKTADRLIQEQKIQPAIIAMPSDGLWGDGSAYFTHHQKQFDHWIADDVPRAIMENIRGADSNSPVCIGGLSMGGYGALMLGARFGEKFKAIAAHSAITAIDQMTLFVEESVSEYTDYCVCPNAIDAIEKYRATLAPLRFDCGVNDPLIEANRLLHQQLLTAKIPHIYEELPGAHEWEYWQRNVEKTLLFFDQYS